LGGEFGAISGLMGAYIYLYPKTKMNFYAFYWYEPIKITIPVWLYLGFWLAIQVVLLRANIPGIGWIAHISGFIFGFVSMVFLRKWNQL
jgi:membrane associated rhomboid family serine protease